MTLKRLHKKPVWPKTPGTCKIRKKSRWPIQKIQSGEIVSFLQQKWVRELDYRLIKEVWAFSGNRIAVRFAYESHNAAGQWYRSYGNENREFDEAGLMRLRIASINDLKISAAERKFHCLLALVQTTIQV
jgi:nuclear transport factor 2 (NTF2) superfamily protein